MLGARQFLLREAQLRLRVARCDRLGLDDGSPGRGELDVGRRRRRACGKAQKSGRPGFHEPVAGTFRTRLVFCGAQRVKWALPLAVLAAGTLVFLPATAIQVPGALRVGNQSLTAASCATRDTLWIHHYVAALYLPSREAAVSALQDPQQPKALHVQILSKSFLPKELPKKWRQTLESQLDSQSFSSIRSAWRGLRVGDRVTIAYAPGGPGVTLQLNDSVVATSPRHDVIDALLKTWADDEPIPQRVNRVVAKNPCRL